MTSLQKRIAIFAAVVVALVAYFTLRPSEEDRVRACVLGAAEAFENEQIITLAGYLSRNYGDEAGRSYQEVLGAAKSIMDRYDGIDLDFQKLDVTLQGDRATVEAKVRASGRDSRGHDLASFFGERDVVEVEIGLSNGSDGWRITKVHRIGDY